MVYIGITVTFICCRNIMKTRKHIKILETQDKMLKNILYKLLKYNYRLLNTHNTIPTQKGVNSYKLKVTHRVIH